MRSALFLLALLSASPVLGQPLAVIPPHATTDTVVTAHVAGTAPGCVPRLDSTTRIGYAAVIRFKTPMEICPPVITDWTSEVTLGTFSPGLYDVEVLVDEQPLATRKLLVSDATPKVIIDPFLVPEAGGVRLAIYVPSAIVASATRVTFDGVDALDVEVVSETSLRATPPPHAAGAVDVVVISSLATVKQPAGLLYYSETAPPDESIFEPRLIPVLDETDGSDGTHWTSTAFFYADNGRAIPLQRPLGPNNTLTGTRSLGGDVARRPRGFFWYPLRELATRAHAAVRVSEATSGAVVDLPSPRERNFSNLLEIFDIPRGPRYRATLRIYSLDREADVQVVTAGLITGGPFAITRLHLVRQADDEPAFAEIPDILNLPVYSLHGPPDDHLRVEVSGSPNARLWAVVSEIDRTTSQFRVFTPED